MKLITLNTHSLAEPDYERKLAAFARLIKKERPHIIALQEVNQTMSRDAVQVPGELGYVPCRDNKVPVREDNHGLALARLLKELGCTYHWTWAPAKVGYEIYEEGLAVFSLSPIEETRQFYISKSHDFNNWKTRKMVGAKADGMWFYSVHMGWWEDEEEPFSSHWDRAVEEIGAHSFARGPVWVMGDFNSPAGIPDGGWAYVKVSGWKDTYDLAKQKDGGVTVGKLIDGWKERLPENGGPEEEGKGAGTKEKNLAGREKGAAGDGGTTETDRMPGMRIDYIWCSREVDVDKSEVICNGINYEVVSDHYGVMITEKGRSFS